MSISSALLAAALWLALLGSGCGPRAATAGPGAGPVPLFGGERTAARKVAAPATVGAAMYSALCGACHGEQGQGDTPLAGDLDPPPTDLTRCNFKLRSTRAGRLPTDEDLLRSLYVGLPGSAMPSFGDLLPLPSLRALVQQVKLRCDRFAEEKAGEPLAVLDAPGAGTAVRARGQGIYVREGCRSCHGPVGRGDGPAAGTLVDAQGRSIRPRDHTLGVFRGGFHAADVYRAFSTGLEGTPMPAVPEEVSAQDRWDLVRYIVSLSDGRSRVWRAMTRPPSWYEPMSRWRRPWQKN